MLPGLHFLTITFFLTRFVDVFVFPVPNFVWLDGMLVSVNIATRGDRLSNVTFVKNYL